MTVAGWIFLGLVVVYLAARCSRSFPVLVEHPGPPLPHPSAAEDWSAHDALVASLPASIRGDFLPPEDERPVGVGPVVERPALTAAQAAGQFTEYVGGALVLPDGLRYDGLPVGDCY